MQEASSEHTASFRAAWALIKPYWFSDEKWRGRLLLLAIVALALGQVAITVRINQWNAAFYNALQDKKFDEFVHQILLFTLFAAAFIAVAVYRQYLNQMLQIRWRSWMTKQYQHNWLTKRAYYRLQVIYKSTDNPDQRIADDIDQFTANTLSLSIGLLSSVVTLLSFVTILWNLSGSLRFTVAEQTITIPGYMVWVALVYAMIGSWLTHRIGRRLVKLNFDQQRFEANYRYSLIRVRENAESVAFYHGEPVEGQALNSSFSHIVANWWQIMRKQKHLTWFTSTYDQIATIFPFVVAAPRYFSGAIQLGGLMQTASAFGRLQDALSWFIGIYPQFASWKATTNRLHGFNEMIATSNSEETTSSIALTKKTTNTLEVQHLALTLPDGTPLLHDIGFVLSPSERLLITGQSGCGKTTLLRAIAGLWPYGEGHIALPKNADLLFIPQKPYLPNLSLREVTCYPNDASNFTDEAIVKALTTAGLLHLTHQLDTIAQWGQSLSLGEQQKLAFARVFLLRPAVLLLDEATASLDEASETHFYETLIAQLPESIVVSIGHRPALRNWHTAEKTL